MPAYDQVVAEAARVLRSGGTLVHVGVHPCFCGGFADRTDPLAVIVRPGYLDSALTTASWTDQGVRDKVGAVHWPLPALFAGFTQAGLKELAEGGTPTAVILGVRLRKP